MQMPGSYTGLFYSAVTKKNNRVELSFILMYF